MQKTSFPAVISTFILCYGFWLLLTWSTAPQELIAGAAVSLAVALFSAKLFIHEKAFRLFNPAKLFSYLLFWLVIFPTELWKANMSMAKICLSGCKSIKPGIVKVPVSLKGDYAQAQLANAITLTPGTMTLDICEDEGKDYYYIHWVDVAEADAVKAGEAIKGRMEKYLGRVWQ